MSKKVYGKPIKTGWVLTLLGIVGIVAGIHFAGSTGNSGFFALMALGGLLVISGIVTVGVYAVMEMGVSRALKDSAPLLRFTIAAQDYAAYAAQQAQEIRSTNKISLIIALVFCGLVAVIGPFSVKHDGIIFAFVGVGLALILTFFAWSITAYRVNKLMKGDKEVVLTSGSAYVGGEFHVWKLPASFLSEVVYFGAGEYEESPTALIRITYNAFTRTIVTPYTVLIPVPQGMEEKAKAAVHILKGDVKKVEEGNK
ncbi:MAG: hypothetical protein HZC17_03260 [Candidatus Omnitrophica bacterium]|nr:hypothetical protein [Candidatus Omnitrophota bacterium]